jgi:antitoxin YokJ
MTTDMDELIELIAGEADCNLLPPSGLPEVEIDHVIPNDLAHFYRVCGGAVLFESSPYRTTIWTPATFTLANPVIVGERGEYDLSSSWYIVADASNRIYVTIDLQPERLGRCYDSSMGRHGNPGSCPIIARSFSEFLNNSFRERGKYLYWLEGEFFSLGDAYDETN